VGWYDRRIFNPLMDAALDRPALHRERRALLRAAGGEILEIGLGTGLNLPDYPEDIEWIAAVGPEPEPSVPARRRAEAAGIAIDFRSASAEAMPFADASFDTVVCTLVLCTIPDPRAAAREIRRVCRDDGQVLVLEHVIGRRRATRLVQRAVQPLHGRIACGCSLLHDAEATLREAGLDVSELERGTSRGLAWPGRDVVRGIARVGPGDRPESA